MFVYKTYALEREADAELSLGDIWNLFQEDALPNNNFCRQMINCMKAWNYLQETSDLHRDYQASTWVNDGRWKLHILHIYTHYIREVKMFDRKPSMLYTMIIKSLVYCWDNFEQNGKMTWPGREI